MSERGRHKVHGRSAGKGPEPRAVKMGIYQANLQRIFKWKKKGKK